MTVELIQFLRPRGAQAITHCDINDSFAEKYALVKANGLRLTAEVLTTGEVSLAIEHPEGDVICELAANGPGDHAPHKVLERMLRDFTQEAFDIWKKENNILAYERSEKHRQQGDGAGRS